MTYMFARLDAVPISSPAALPLSEAPVIQRQIHRLAVRRRECYKSFFFVHLLTHLAFSTRL